MRTTSFMAGLGAVLLTVVLVTSSPAQEYVLSLAQLTTHPEVDYYPSWSPDGRTIAFSSSRNGGNLWLVPATGGEPEQLTQHEANHPSWSPEGSFIAFDRNRGSEAGIISPHGGLSVRIVPESVPITRGAHPCWSRDGKRIFFTSEGAIWAVDPPTGKLEPIFQRAGHFARAFSISRDGRWLAADMDTSSNKREDDIWLLPLQGGLPRQLTDYPGREGNPMFSPDGTMIAFMDDQDGFKRIMVIDAIGSRAVKLTNYVGFNANPRWSPDGEQIVFASDRGGNIDIWVMKLDVPALKKALGF